MSSKWITSLFKMRSINRGIGHSFCGIGFYRGHRLYGSGETDS